MIDDAVSLLVIISSEELNLTVKMSKKKSDNIYCLKARSNLTTSEQLGPKEKVVSLSIIVEVALSPGLLNN